MTYNLAELPLPPNSLHRILKSKPSLLSSTFLFLSSCETEPLKPRRTEGSRSVAFRTQCVTSTCASSYTPLAIHSIGGVQAILLVKDAALGNVTSVKVADVACGIGNVVHNKGGIGVWVGVDWGGKRKRLLFVCSHLAAHERNVKDRNADFWRIVSELEAGSPPFRRGGREPAGKRTGVKLFDDVDHVFWCGDLNYRLTCPRSLIEAKLFGWERKPPAKVDYESILRHDQLRDVMRKGEAFLGLEEAKIAFPPTYNYTDRILYKPGGRGSGVSCLCYDWVRAEGPSDHRPVVASFRVEDAGEGGETGEEITK